MQRCAEKSISSWRTRRGVPPQQRGEFEHTSGDFQPADGNDRSNHFENGEKLNSLLQSRNSLVLKNPNYNTTVFRLAISFFVLGYLATLAHRTWGQHIRKRDMTLL